MSATADQALIGRDQRDVRVDPDPAVAGEHLNVEMQMAGRASDTILKVRDNADLFAFAHTPSVHYAVGIEMRRVHVDVSETDMLVAAVDQQDNTACSPGARIRTPSRTATVAKMFGMQRSAPSLRKQTGRWAYVLTLMAHAVGALADFEVARFAEIILPRIAVVFLCGFVEHERLVVALAMVSVAFGLADHDTRPVWLQSPQFRMTANLRRQATFSSGKRICE